jgi:hypothetical protein
MTLIIILIFATIELIGYDIIRFMRFNWGHIHSFGYVADIIIYLY